MMSTCSYCLILLLLPTFCHSGTSPIFSLDTCIGGCRENADCPDNSACIPVLAQSCGLCLCTLGFVANGDRCVVAGPKIKGDSGSNHLEMITVAPKVLNESEINLAISGSFDQQSVAEPWSCDKYICKSEDGCPEDNGKSPPVQCSGLTCAAGTCMQAGSNKGVCICPFDRTSRRCQAKKLGDCSSTTGLPPPEPYLGSNQRFIHQRDPDYGAILSRHKVRSMSECIRLCQWATPSQCRSLNFGNVNGTLICELLTIWASPDGALFNWLKPQENWSYLCCFK